MTIETTISFLPVLITAALIDSVNPCAFSVLILTIAFLASLGRHRPAILRISLVYVAGIFLTYLAIGLGLLKVLEIFSAPHFMGKLGASLVIVIGAVNLANGLFPKFPIKPKLPKFIHPHLARFMSRASAPAAFVLGVLVGLFEFPCTGGPYFMILGMLHDEGMFLSGLSYLLLYNFIFVLPLLVILFIASRRVLLEKVDEWRKSKGRKMKIWNGLVMVALGLVIIALY